MNNAVNQDGLQKGRGRRPHTQLAQVLAHEGGRPCDDAGAINISRCDTMLQCVTAARPPSDGVECSLFEAVGRYFGNQDRSMEGGPLEAVPAAIVLRLLPPASPCRSASQLQQDCEDTAAVAPQRSWRGK